MAVSHRMNYLEGEENLAESLNNRIIVALDVDGYDRALLLARELAGSGCWLKVGLELFTATGPRILQDLKSMGFSLFLDLKLHDIPNTVGQAAQVLAGYGIDMLTVHCSGGYEMMARAVEAVRVGSVSQTPKLIGVTVLTSIGEEQLRQEQGVERSLEEQVLALAALAQKAGLDGVVASAQEASQLRQAFGQEFLIVTPGIRPTWSERQDQVRVLTPQEALKAGSSYLVVGRPVTRAENPRAALERLWE